LGKEGTENRRKKKDADKDPPKPFKNKKAEGGVFKK